jgi:Pvc16 N-terminal domain/Carboxypeptidase regulatory-like domain
MFQDVDETLRSVLLADVPIKRNEVDIAFDRPTRDWSSRLTRPTLNAFLYEIRERADLKDDVPLIARDENGRAVRQRPPRRLDLLYLISAWTTEADDEHRILARVLASLYRFDTIAPDLLQGELKSSNYPVLARVPRQDEVSKPAELWGVIGNDHHASLTWVWTVPLDAFKPTVGPLVRTAEIRVGLPEQPADVVLVEVGGLVHRKGQPLSGVPGVRLSIVGTAHAAESDDEGKFSFANLPAGDYKWRIEPPGGKAREQKISVPSAAYDIEV